MDRNGDSPAKCPIEPLEFRDLVIDSAPAHCPFCTPLWVILPIHWTNYRSDENRYKAPSSGLALFRDRMACESVLFVNGQLIPIRQRCDDGNDE